ncbi:MAG: thiamine phosphate synthase [Bacilli bacterium]|nr:thiamine phosphate synthase [Bacilli bacterium]
MNNISFNDETDILINNYFSQYKEKEKFDKFIKVNHLDYNTLKERYFWLKKMNINPNIIHLKENHETIYKIFDRCNSMFNENNIEYYYTSGILSYLLVNKKLQRYHHDLDIFVNMKDLENLERICCNYGFIFKRQLGDRNDGTKRVMLKMYYEDAIEIPITLFMYVRQEDNTIEQNDYFIDNSKFYVEKIYNSPLVVNLSFSDEPQYHNDIKYFAITLEALYLSKVGNRPKDIYDCSQFEKYLDLHKVSRLNQELSNNMPNEVFTATEDPYYNFIFSEFETKKKSMEKIIDYSLYLCTDSNINKDYDIQECVHQAILGGVTIVQVREKNKNTDEFCSIAEKIKSVTDKYNVPLIINDNIEVALKTNADGIHIGQDDISCLEARKTLGKNKIIGVTVTTLEEAKKAIEQGATYLGVGTIYKSTTKKDAKIVSQEELNKIINYCKLPIVVIGGINENTIPNFKKRNISGYAMIRPILGNKNIMESTMKLKKLVLENKI